MNSLLLTDIQHWLTAKYVGYNRQVDSPESLIIAPPHLLAAIVALLRGSFDQLSYV